jgi:hypothetical protein
MAAHQLSAQSFAVGFYDFSAQIVCVIFQQQLQQSVVVGGVLRKPL